MLNDVKKLAEARKFITSLSEGNNPLTCKPLKDSVLNDPEVIRVMFYVKDILDRVASGELRSNTKDAFPYAILEDFRYTGDVGITGLLRRICAPVKGENVQMPSPQMAGAWLREEGYLMSEYSDEYHSEVVLPTEKGKAIGIYTKTRQFQGRSFVQLFYSRPAQEFIIENFDKLLNYRRSDL